MLSFDQLFTTDKTFKTHCIPTGRFRADNTVICHIFRCFKGVWKIAVDSRKIDDVDCVGLQVSIDERYTFARKVTATIVIKYAGLTLRDTIDLPKTTQTKYERLCTREEYLDIVAMETEMDISVEIDESSYLEMHRSIDFNQPNFLTDARIITDSKIFHVSKSLLSLYSPIFLDGFKRSDTLDLSHISGEKMQTILERLYPPYQIPAEWMNCDIQWRKDSEYWPFMDDRNENDDISDNEGDEDVEEQNNVNDEHEQMRQLLDLDGHDAHYVDLHNDSDNEMDQENVEEQNNVNDEHENIRHIFDWNGHDEHYAGLLKDSDNVHDIELKRVAKELQLSGVLEMVQNKMKDDNRNGNEFEDEGLEWHVKSIYYMNEFDDKYWKAWSSPFNLSSGLPIIFENRFEGTMKVEEEMKFEFLGCWDDYHGPWKICVADCEDDGKTYLMLETPYTELPLVPNGTIQISINCDPPIHRSFVLDFSDRSDGISTQNLGTIPEEVIDECDINIIMDIEKINGLYMRGRVDYSVFNGDICNGTVTVEGQKFNVCKELLCFNSPIFFNMFQHSSDIELHEISVGQLHDLLDVIYPSMLLPNSFLKRHDTLDLREPIENMLSLSKLFDIEVVREVMSAFIRLVDNHKNAPWLASLFPNYDIPKAVRHTGTWRGDDWRNVMKRPEFRTWPKRYQIDIFDYWMDMVHWENKERKRLAALGYELYGGRIDTNANT